MSSITTVDQFVLLDLNENNPKIKQMIIDFINQYKDVKTILYLRELFCSPKNLIQRPQKPWVLFRKYISTGLNMPVEETSEIASYLWKNKSEREYQFWYELYKITKEIYLEHPDYEYTSNERDKETKESDIMSENNLDIKPKELIDIDMSEVDIYMLDADLYYNDNDNDLYSIDPSFSYIDF